MRKIVIPAFLVTAVLAACGTPQEQCIRRGTQDIRTLDRLIAESRATVTRGYAIEEYTTYMPVWRTCGFYRVSQDSPPQPQMCLEDEARVSTRPKAVNLVEERAKLASMEQRRKELDRAAAPIVAACRAQHPE